MTGRRAVLDAMSHRPADGVTRHPHTTTHFVEIQADSAEAHICNAAFGR